MYVCTQLYVCVTIQKNKNGMLLRRRGDTESGTPRGLHCTAWPCRLWTGRGVKDGYSGQGVVVQRKEWALHVCETQRRPIWLELDNRIVEWPRRWAGGGGGRVWNGWRERTGLQRPVKSRQRTWGFVEQNLMVSYWSAWVGKCRWPNSVEGICSLTEESPGCHGEVDMRWWCSHVREEEEKWKYFPLLHDPSSQWTPDDSSDFPTFF